jgi:glycosyltransferase involved in cell wall biosynthesis
MINPCRILRVVIGLNQGGVQQGVLNLCSTVDRRRFEIIVVAIENGGAIAKEIEKLGVKVIVLGFQRKTLKTIFALRKIILDERISIVHASSYHPALYSRIAALVSGRPKVICYEHVVFGNDRPIRRFLNRVLDRYTEAYTAVGGMVAQQVKDWYGYMPEKVRVINNGVDISRFRPALDRLAVKAGMSIDPKKMVIGMICRLDEEKGHRYFFEAIKIIENVIDAEYLVVGTGRMQDKIQALPYQIGIRSNVRFLGLRRDIPELLRAFDIYVFPTLQEGFPNSLLEAMASGVAVAVSNFPANTEIVTHRENGMVFEMRNSPQLAQTILDLSGDDVLREKLASAGRELMESKYAIEAYGDSMMSLYDEIAEK